MMKTGGKSELLGEHAGPQKIGVTDDMSNTQILNMQQMEMKSLFIIII